MFSTFGRNVATPLRPCAQPSLAGACAVQARNAATLKSLSIRMRSIKNMQKITKAMKMVAAAKMRKDQRALDLGFPFTKPVTALFERLPREEKAGNITYLAVTSDKGLCGGVNSAVNKQVRLNLLEEEAKGNVVKIMVLGGKGVAGLKRLYGDRFSTSFEEASKREDAQGPACPGPWVSFHEAMTALFERLPREEKSGNITYLAVTSDKGLCGGVNSAVNKQVRLNLLEEEAKGNVVKIMVLGGKGVAGLKRLYGDRFSTSFEEASKSPWTYATASLIAERLIKANPARAKIVGNTFKSMVVYHTRVDHTVTMKEAQTMDRTEWSKAMDVYSFEPSIYEVWDDLHEFYYASAIHAAFLNSAITETSQRMSAMENASKNAGEMLEKVTLQFNRARQAKITTELCEIISGASAV
eukprot:CAMPEP_0194550576 /NCGR_PEP_ID=MMETSP0253-20130528/95781_1 /TAXON_ID=2966 /ORGANISM="Noctiluca scintillans" /LENGTH=411 /DNA_ID=CAMNT_0039398015 /DNA_START=71 /DNA_END=1307 /DNA_ORIENTATION=-